MIKNLFVALVAGFILWAFDDFHKDRPTVTYIISDAIEIPGPKGDPEYAQEVLVINSGPSVARAISIKVPHHISTHKLTKHSNQIEENIFSEANSFELVYPELPSEQKIRVLLRYDGDPIEKDWISISHADGNAQAQENEAPDTNYFLIWLAFLFGMLTQIIGDFRKWKREALTKWADKEDVMRNDKPWYASSAEWSEMQFEAINRCLNRYNYSDVKETFCYQLLNHSKPALLPEEKWMLLQKEASDLLMAKFSKEVTWYTRIEKLVDFYKLEKPEALSIELWSNFKKLVIEMLTKQLLPRYSDDYEQLVAILDADNVTLKNLSETDADKIRKTAQELYTNYLSSYETLGRRSDPLTILKEARFDLLTKEQKDRIEEKVLQFARMQKMPSSWDIHTLEKFISKKRPEWMPENEFKSICELVTQSKSLSEKCEVLNSQQAKLASTRLETEKLMNRVLSQLDLIDRIITNPDVIEKIEDYDQTFAPGNKQNLRLIASLLKSAPVKCEK